MSIVGADYSAGRPGGAALAAAGVKVVGRYAAGGRASINVTAAEVRDLRAHGIDVFIYNEHEASYMMGGAARAAAVAPAAVQVCRDAGLPDGPIFYAVDYDATLGGPAASPTALANMRTLADFLTGAARVTSWDAVGVYGGYYVIKWLLDNLPNLTHAVQTSAWSGGHWDARAFCRQDGYNWMINGVNCDHLTVVNPDEGSLRYRTGDDMSQADVDAITKALAAQDKALRADLPGLVQAAVHGTPVGRLVNPDKTPVTFGQILAGEFAEHPITPAQAQQLVAAGISAQVQPMTAAVVDGIRSDFPEVQVDYTRMGQVVAARIDEHLGSLRVTSDAPPAPAATSEE